MEIYFKWSIKPKSNSNDRLIHNKSYYSLVPLSLLAIPTLLYPCSPI